MLKLLQQELPKLWTDELYSEEFRASPSRYKDFDHALKHLRKAAQALENMTEEADHGGQPFKTSDMEKYLADLVICTVRLALKAPNFQVDLEKAVVDRIEKKMGAKLVQPELLKHLKYTVMLLERLGPGPMVDRVHREEAYALLPGTLDEARAVIAKAEGH